MDYLELMKRQPVDREALVEDGISFSYGDLVRMAQETAQRWRDEIGSSRGGAYFSQASVTQIGGGDSMPDLRCVHVIKEKRILRQLVSFLACFAVGEVPLVVPWESRYFEGDSRIMRGEVPMGACVAVATSGTSGRPKIYFRTYQSWAGYFPVQNEIFHIGQDSRLFVQGSLSFTGNLNLYLAQFYAGGSVIAENGFYPREWERRMEEHRADGIYLIPTKLLLMPKLLKKKNLRIRTIISGSQSLGRSDAQQLKTVFPNARVTLYYGATELNYITYVTDDIMTEQRNLIGKPFPEVQVQVQGEEIFVDTAYHVEGIVCPYTLSDRGAVDEEGNFYFLGRTDDILLYRGHKVSAHKIENALEEIEGIEEAAVIMTECGGKPEEHIVAYVVASEGKDTFGEDVTSGGGQSASARVIKWQEKDILRQLRKKLPRFELPRRIYFVKTLPKNASGKVDKRQLGMLE